MPDHSDYPYPGPRPYRTDESELFAGRDHEIAELCSLIISHQVVVLYAQSGAGKSSLLNAGLIPVLKRKQVTVLPVSRVGLPIPTEVSPTDVKNVYAFSAIADLLPERQAAGAASDNETILDVIKRIPHEVDDAGELKLRMIAFDQFEELFSTHAHRWPERRSFIEQVSKALAADRMLRVLLVLREDYLATFGDFADLLPEQARTRYHLERLREPEALAAVLHPLEHTRWRFEDGVAETLVRDLLAITVETSSGTTTVTGEFVEPVQLQIVCSALLQRLPPGRTSITMSDLMAFGRPDEALQTFYDAAIEAISRMGFEERRVRAWFEMYLITPAGTRGLVFRGAETTGGLPNFIVDALERSHIIRPEIRSGSRWYELTHDRFIRPIQSSNQKWNERLGWLSTVLRKSSDLRESDLESPEQIKKQERLAIVTEELVSEESRTVISREMDDLARKYETTRASMPASRSRTIAMNEVMAQMRALARACAPFWNDYAHSDSPGRRLAAIAILQMGPDLGKLPWLKERIVEKPFVFYHAALAVQNMAREFGKESRGEILAVASAALKQVKSVPGVAPDRNTVVVLENVVRMLGG